MHVYGQDLEQLKSINVISGDYIWDGYRAFYYPARAARAG